MFSLLLELVGQDIIAGNSNYEYKSIMHSNGTDGPRFIKPERGHEDGCVQGFCAESHAGEYAQ